MSPEKPVLKLHKEPRCTFGNSAVRERSPTVSDRISPRHFPLHANLSIAFIPFLPLHSERANSGPDFASRVDLEIHDLQDLSLAHSPILLALLATDQVSAVRPTLYFTGGLLTCLFSAINIWAFQKHIEAMAQEDPIRWVVYGAKLVTAFTIIVIGMEARHGTESTSKYNLYLLYDLWYCSRRRKALNHS